jgi:hypothetical protein
MAAKRGLLLLILWPSAAPAMTLDNGADALFFTHTYQAVNNHVTGAGASRSFLTRGNTFIDDWTVNLRTSVNSNPAEHPERIFWDIGASGRTTDDQKTDIREFSLQQMYIRATTRDHALSLGDYFANLAPYALTTSLKGAQYQYNYHSGLLQVTTLDGLQKSRWDQVWEHQNNEGTDRAFYGGGLAMNQPDGFSLNGTAVHGWDRHAVGDKASLLYADTVADAQWALPPALGLKLSGETAWSWYETKNTAQETTAEKFASVHHIKAGYSSSLLNSQSDFEYTPARFATLGGAASPDLERVTTNNTLNINRRLQWLLMNFTWFQDNLAHIASIPTHTTKLAETGIRYQGAFDRENLGAEIKGRWREADIDVARVNQQRDSFLSLIMSVSDRFGPISPTLNYDAETEHGNVSGTDASRVNQSAGAGFNYFQILPSGYQASGGLNYNLQRNRDILLEQRSASDLVNGQASLRTPWGLEIGGDASRNVSHTNTTQTSDIYSWNTHATYNLTLWGTTHRINVSYGRHTNRFLSARDAYDEYTFRFSLQSTF